MRLRAIASAKAIAGATAARRSLRLAVSLAGFAVLAACGFDGPAYTLPPTDVAASVEMSSSLSFVPAEVKIKAGDTIEWRNRSLQAHTVTTDPVLVREPRRVGVPEGATVFHSGPVWPGEIFRYTFSVPGTYRYACVPHERYGMRGVVIVEP